MVRAFAGEWAKGGKAPENAYMSMEAHVWGKEDYARYLEAYRHTTRLKSKKKGLGIHIHITRKDVDLHERAPLSFVCSSWAPRSFPAMRIYGWWAYAAPLEGCRAGDLAADSQLMRVINREPFLGGSPLPWADHDQRSCRKRR